jgi:hypothetical protein
VPGLPGKANPPVNNSGFLPEGRSRERTFAAGLRSKFRTGVLRLMEKAVIEIIGAPVACAEGFTDPWREAAGWAAEKLKKLYGEGVEIIYYDLFAAECPTLGEGAVLPAVLVNGEAVIMGGKISIPLIRSKLEELGVKKEMFR